MTTDIERAAGVGLDFMDGNDRIQDVQIVNREGRTVFSVKLTNGKHDPDGYVLLIPALAAHIPYFIDLCERHVRL